MKKNRVTDLEEFALYHIIKPYQELGGFGTFEENIKTLPVPLECLCEMLNEENEWSKLTLDRISKIGFYFPSYIKHDLVRIIESLFRHPDSYTEIRNDERISKYIKKINRKR